MTPHAVHTPPTPSVWPERDLANPHAHPDKSSRVRAMFAAIAPSYDLNNRVHSLGLDQRWRRAAVRAAKVKSTDTVLDVACGTGDLTAAFRAAGPRRVIGLDFTPEMLHIAKRKTAPNQPHPPSYGAADAMRLPLADHSVDVVSIAFGLRNVADPAKAIAEFYRVLRPSGRLVVLEFSTPTHQPIKALYNFYFTQVLPRTAALIARDRSGAYRYLPRSVQSFHNRRQLVDMITAAGFTQPAARPLTLGIAVIYTGQKTG